MGSMHERLEKGGRGGVDKERHMADQDGNHARRHESHLV